LVFKIGHADDPQLQSGVTVVIPDVPVTAAVHVMGGAPGTRETDLLSPDKLVQKIDGLVLSGGSAFGLDAASGVQAWLREQGRGHPVGEVRVPIVPAAILFDLNNGGDKAWGRYPPYRELGYKAACSLGHESPEGRVGAGTGATVAGRSGGLGVAAELLGHGVEVSSLVVCNAVGSVTLADTDYFWAAPFERDNEFGGLGWPDEFPAGLDEVRTKGQVSRGEATTLAIVMTNAALSQAECQRMAINAHDGFARAIYPSHTPVDGDIVFALSSGEIATDESELRQVDLLTAACNTVSRAIARGVYHANKPGDK
jgi:L-aminopeptidase/D-esterase-like protein